MDPRPFEIDHRDSDAARELGESFAPPHPDSHTYDEATAAAWKAYYEAIAAAGKAAWQTALNFERL